MGAKYTTQSASGYNSSPPPDDGSQSASNLITWLGIKAKLGDPVKTLADAINTALIAALNTSVRQISVADSTVASDHMRTIEIAPTVTNTVTVSLGDAATMTSTYLVAVKNSSAVNQIISRATSGDTIDGIARNITIPAGASLNFTVNSSANGYLLISSYEESEPGLCEARLTLTSGTAVNAADVFSATTMYLTPFRGNRVSLFDGTRWRKYVFSEVSIACPSVSSTVHDVFLYDNAGTLTLDATAWSNDTTRATALTTQDGILVKSGATGRRYVGTFRTTSIPGQTEDSAAKRYVWNYYNRVLRPMRCATETTDTWSYSTSTIRQARASTANQLDFVCGVSEDAIKAELIAGGETDTLGTEMAVGIGLDSTTAFVSGFLHSKNDAITANRSIQMTATWKGFPGIGRHILTWLEYAGGVGTTTWYGDNGSPTRTQSGIHGELLG